MGFYEFTGLLAGNYIVRVVSSGLPSGSTFTTQNVGADDNIDSDVNASGVTSCINLPQGATNYTVDAGHFRASSIGDFVWNDLNGNGLQDGGEPGISGVTVKLYDDLGTLQATTTTNSAGTYIFMNVLPGDYYLVFSTPQDYSFIDANVGGNDNTDSDVTGQIISGSTAIFSVPEVPILPISMRDFTCARKLVSLYGTIQIRMIPGILQKMVSMA